MRILLLCLWLSVAGSLAAETNGVWKTDFTNALNAAGVNGKPVLVQFHASWCGPCRMMKQSTLKDDSVLKSLEQFTCLSLDFDAHPDLAKRYGVQAIPAFLVLDPEGNLAEKSIGFRNAADFNQWLTDGLAAVAFVEGQRAVFRQKCAEINAKLRNPDEKPQAIALLLDFCNRERIYQEFAAEKLKPLAAENPAQLFEGLNHPRLATRIHVANLLRESLKERFNYDPWETAENRAKAIAVLKANSKPRP